MRLTNPFEEMSLKAKRLLFKRQIEEQQLVERFEKLVSRYRDILQDPRYRLIEQDMQVVLGEQLNALVTRASRCPRCVKEAERIKLLQQVIAAPLSTVWYANQQERAQEESVNGEDDL